MKKKINKWETPPSVLHNENEGWHDTCQRTVEKFNRVQIVTSRPKINIDKFRTNYDLIDWKHKKAMNESKAPTITQSILP